MAEKNRRNNGSKISKNCHKCGGKWAIIQSTVVKKIFSKKIRKCRKMIEKYVVKQFPPKKQTK